MKTKIIIKGTHCNSCKALIEDFCKEVEGVSSCEVNFQTGEMVVEHNENLDWGKLKKEIESLAEYKVEINK